MNLAEILQQYYYQTDFVNYVAQFGFPVDYVGPEYHAFFRDKDLIPNAHAHGFKVAPWPVGVESRDDLRQLFRLDPELVVTNKRGGRCYPHRAGPVGRIIQRGLTALFFWSIIVLYRTVLCETVRRSNIHSKGQTRRMIL